jgi:hypothetical protein
MYTQRQALRLLLRVTFSALNIYIVLIPGPLIAATVTLND